jgi:hypothetical protein
MRFCWGICKCIRHTIRHVTLPKRHKLNEGWEGCVEDGAGELGTGSEIRREEEQNFEGITFRKTRHNRHI